jgi:hypothetical protein
MGIQRSLVPAGETVVCTAQANALIVATIDFAF